MSCFLFSPLILLGFVLSKTVSLSVIPLTPHNNIHYCQNGSLITVNTVQRRCYTGTTKIQCLPRTTDTELLSSSSSSSIDSSNFFSTLLNRLQGDFDNYYQVYNDIHKHKLTPKEGGSHEHFHVTLIPIDIDLLSSTNDNVLFGKERSNDNQFGVVLAAYYFDGIPNRIFRLRLYTLYEQKMEEEGDNENSDEYCVMMKLHILHPTLEKAMRQAINDKSNSSNDVLHLWLQMIQKVSHEMENDFVTELNRCDIRWTKSLVPERHTYFDGDCQDPISAFHAIMINDHDKGGVLLESQMAPGLFLRIQDELSLWDDELWVNDRGHDAKTGKMVYGNYLGIPYKMKRVANLKSIGDKTFFKRVIVDTSLSWTLGDEYRSSELYKAKMDDIGGTTTTYNPKTAKNEQ